ncbi:dnaJ domain protein [Diplocarpon mali]|nr:dnaJ domain protein [Diplocarpon mali]
MATIHDHYTILGIDFESTGEEIRIAYWLQSLLKHPDKYRDKVLRVTQEFQLLGGAFKTLSDKRLRKIYDIRYADSILKVARVKVNAPLRNQFVAARAAHEGDQQEEIAKQAASKAAGKLAREQDEAIADRYKASWTAECEKAKLRAAISVEYEEKRAAEHVAYREQKAAKIKMVAVRIARQKATAPADYERRRASAYKITAARISKEKADKAFLEQRAKEFPYHPELQRWREAYEIKVEAWEATEPDDEAAKEAFKSFETQSTVRREALDA